MFIWSAYFKKQFKKLSVKIRAKLEDRLEVFVDDEFASILKNHELHGEYRSCRSINITGDIRLIYKNLENGTYYLVAIGTHSQLYE